MSVVNAISLTLLVLAMLLGLLHLVARAMCRRKGHRWRKERHPETDAPHSRCQRCRVWVAE